MPTAFTQIESPVGPLLLAADDTGLRSINFINGRHSVSPDPAWHEDPETVCKNPFANSAPTSPENLRLSISPSPPGHNVSTRRLAQPMRNSLRTNHLLRRTGPPPRQPERLASSRAGERIESDPDRDSLPSGNREQRQTHRLRRGPADQGKAAGPGTPPTSSAVRSSL